MNDWSHLSLDLWLCIIPPVCMIEVQMLVPLLLIARYTFMMVWKKKNPKNTSVEKNWLNISDSNLVCTWLVKLFSLGVIHALWKGFKFCWQKMLGKNSDWSEDTGNNVWFKKNVILVALPLRNGIWTFCFPFLLLFKWQS